MYIFQVRYNYLIFFLEKDIIIIKKKGTTPRIKKPMSHYPTSAPLC